MADLVKQYIDIDSLLSIANYDWLNEDLVSEFLAQSISWVTIQWIKRGMDTPVVELADVYVKIFHSPIIQVISKNDK